MNQINQMAVVVTGASTGIGAACALDCVGRGMTVFAGVRDPRAGEALAAKGGPLLIPITLDVTDGPSIARSLEVVQQVVGCLLYTSPSPRDRQKARMPSSA